MFGLSKNLKEFKVNETRYRLKTWNTMSQTLMGKKVALILAPMLASAADVKNHKNDSLDSIINGDEPDFLLTTMLTTVANSISDEFFMDLVEKLLSSLEYKVKEPTSEEGEFDWSDWKEVTDINEHFDDEAFADNYDGVMLKSAEVNLYDFFMRQRMFRSKIEGMMDQFKTILPQQKNESQDGTTEQ